MANSKTSQPLPAKPSPVSPFHTFVSVFSRLVSPFSSFVSCFSGVVSPFLMFVLTSLNVVSGSAHLLSCFSGIVSPFLMFVLTFLMFVSSFLTFVSPFSSFVSIFITNLIIINTLSMLSFNLAPVFKARSISNPYTFLVKAGIARHTAHRILSNQVRVFRLDHIELLCRLLVCEPNDILVYTPSANQPLPEDHPLQSLRPSAPAPNVKETLSTIPFKQLQQLASQIEGSV